MSTQETSFGISFGAMSPSIAKQLKKLKLKFVQHNIDAFQRFSDSIIGLKIAGILSPTETDKCQKRLYNQIAGHVEKENGLTIGRLKV